MLENDGTLTGHPARMWPATAMYRRSERTISDPGDVAPARLDSDVRGFNTSDTVRVRIERVR